LNGQKKFDILKTMIKILDVIFVFFITLNIALILIGGFEWVPPWAVWLHGESLASPEYLYITRYLNKFMIFGGIMAISLSIPIFIAIRLPLVYKLKILKFALIKKKYGGNEDLLKFYREFHSGSFSDKKYKKLEPTHNVRR
jgi:hypothetical protein